MQVTDAPDGPDWTRRFDLEPYDRNASLTEAERAALESLASYGGTASQWFKQGRLGLERLLRPLRDVTAYLGADIFNQRKVARLLAKEMHKRQRSYWGWSDEEWIATIAPTQLSFEQLHRSRGDGYRRYVITTAYLLADVVPFQALGAHFSRYDLACTVFGADRVNLAVQRVAEVVTRWGYTELHGRKPYLRPIVASALLLNRDPRLEALTEERLEELRPISPYHEWSNWCSLLSRALAHLGILSEPLPAGKPSTPLEERILTAASNGDVPVPPEWTRWCLAWHQLSTLHPKTKEKLCFHLLRVGRWLRRNRPDVVGPEGWTYELAAEYVAAVDRMTVGELSGGELAGSVAKIRGKPVGPTTKSWYLSAMRTFFQDLQEAGKIPVRFNPIRAFATPASIRRAIGPDPRVIDPTVWAKILWAAMNLGEEDLMHLHRGGFWYPPEMVRALAAVWCFSGLRSDEIQRLRVGCISWQREDITIQQTAEILPKDAVCFLRVPVNKTNTAFTKPVHPLSGQRIEEWEKVRPDQPPRIDPKTGEVVHYLFSFRNRAISKAYINRSLIPALCRKVGIPQSDARGRITSHRARSTIASMLYNAKAPMSLFELQEWLGHRSPGSTQHYAKVSPTKLARAYVKSGYMEQNLATVEVLLDLEALAAGEKRVVYYDMGWALCSNPMWWQCKFRMACVRCDYCVHGDQAVLVRSKEGIHRMREDIPLTEDEKKALDGDEEALDALIERNADVPTPAGPTPRELGAIPLRQI